ncbi:iron-containing alcohol dehydrogenase [Streptomyces sp. SID8379]|uniref:maleylacetate reductase n=1 Tax=unclassified Streptomyces TaxID=2593676 RepID=UPI000374C4D5|nr:MULTISPECIES: maleylacetate reductase [unclassified Streptomyces]MYW70073.1 iron-containing alcohol dehydrogenase [Streptomyces sp. SID8379]
MNDHPTDPTAGPSPTPVTVHETLPTRVLIGPGSRHDIPRETERIGARRILLVSTASAAGPADELARALGPCLAGRFDRIAAHTPVTVTEEAVRVRDDVSADSVVALGGGSAVGLAKALSVRTGIPQIAVPTTYAGSEATPVLGETRDGVKTTRRGPEIAPGTIVYDPELTLTMPPGLTLTSALNALAHAVETLWAPQVTVVGEALATEAADGILATLPRVLDDPSHIGHRGRLQESAWLAGLCLAGTRMGLHHQLAHALGGTYDLPHAALHTLLLPHVMAFNLPYAPTAAARLNRVAGGDPVAAVTRLARSYDGPTTLTALGVPRDGLRPIAERVAAAPHPNPRTVTTDAVTRLLEGAL